MPLKRAYAFRDSLRTKRAKKSMFARYRKASRKTPRRQKSTVAMGLGFPSKVTQTHKYVEGFLVSPTAGAMATYNFNANGMYDPNRTGTGHQPMYFDQMMALYDHYVVTKARITVTICPAAQSNVVLHAGLFENDDGSTTPSSVEYIAEQTSGSTRHIGANSTDPVKLTKTYRPKKIWGASPLSMAAQQGSAAANPTEETVWTLAIQNVTTGATTACWVSVSIVYDCVWTEVKDQAGS